MVNAIIKFYEKKISGYSLIFKHMKFIFYTYLVIGIILILLVFPALLMEHVILKIIFGVLIALFCVFFILLNTQAKRILKRKFKIEQRGFIWNDKDLINVRVTMLKDFLDQNEVNSVKKIEALMNLLSKEAERRKFTGLIIPGAFLAFTVPLWNHIVGSFFKNINNINIAIAYGLVLASVVLLFVIGYSMIKLALLEIVEHQNRKLKTLEGLLENIHFNYVLKDESSK
ncbi:hypothetical protein ABEX29_15645 [Brevibacillus porteri]|uniref:hypothetical protein n=1 Tax=Brevibacillus porteri TaxID=2126350 RepID=UPI003D20E9BB